MTHDLGDAVTLAFDTTAGGAYVQPTTVSLTVYLPDGTTVVPAVAPDPWGRHRVGYTPVQPGRHTVRWVATGAGARSHTDVFNVREVRSVALCSLAGVRRHLNMTADVDDEELRGHVEAATEVVERHLNEVVARRTFTATVTAGQLLPRRPVLGVTSATTVPGGAVVDVSGWVPDPSTGLVTVPGAGRGSTPTYLVTYQAGYTVVPPERVLAAEIIAAHLWETQRPPAAGPPRIGDIDGGEPAPSGWAVPARAVELLGGRTPVVA